MSENSIISEDIRWKQRFHNFNNALICLEDAVIKYKELDVLQQAGAIHFFEMCFDLSWKLLKDYLEYLGYQDINSPRVAIKEAFSANLISDGHAWLELLKARNSTSHIYDKDTAQQVLNDIGNKYYQLFKDLQEFFTKKYYDDSSEVDNVDTN